MEIRLSEKIREFRKKQGMTQEQLAEALGVTVGAVYKWENGRSLPELRLLIEMADLFEISVDALLNYHVRNNDCKHVVEHLKESFQSQPNADTLLEAEKAVKKYPNHFEVIYCSASVYQVAGIVHYNRKWSKRALELFRHALLLIDQNTNEEISALSIRVEMASIYSWLEEREEAIRILRENNPLNINDSRIGNELAALKRPEEAVGYLSRALIKTLVTQIQISNGYLNVYMEQKAYNDAEQMLHWALSSFRALKRPDMSSFLNRVEAAYLAVLGEVCLRTHRQADAVQALRQARQTAQEFDAVPDYSVNRLRFVSPEEHSHAHDDMGSSAMEAVRNILQEIKHEELTQLWEEINHE